jgi:hypothetical protein
MRRAMPVAASAASRQSHHTSRYVRSRNFIEEVVAVLTGTADPAIDIMSSSGSRH